MNQKAEQFLQMLKQFPDDSVFQLREIEENDDNLVLFQSSLEAKKDMFVPMGVFIDDTIFTVVRVAAMVGAVNDENRVKVRDFLASLNLQYKFKHYDNEHGDIILEAAIVSDIKHFDPEIIAAVIDMIWDHLKRVYDEIEKVVAVDK